MHMGHTRRTSSGPRSSQIAPIGASDVQSLGKPEDLLRGLVAHCVSWDILTQLASYTICIVDLSLSYLLEPLRLFQTPRNRRLAYSQSIFQFHLVHVPMRIELIQYVLDNLKRVQMDNPSTLSQPQGPPLDLWPTMRPRLHYR